MTRLARAGIWLAWPVGLALALGHLLGGLLSDPLFLVVDLVYVAAVAVAVRLGAATRDRVGLTLLGAGVGIFALASLTGAPTADRPTAMLLNGAALLAAAITLMAGAAALAYRTRDLPALLGLVALAVGSAGYLLNLLARWAVVLSGAAPQQAAVEDRAWIASAYLRGLDGAPDPVALLLVWLDLVQVAYLVLAYLAFAALATSAGRSGAVSARAARAIAVTGYAAAGIVIVSAALAAYLPAPLQGIAAEAAFVLTIPFMSTLVPALLGSAMLVRADRPG